MDKLNSQVLFIHDNNCSKTDRTHKLFYGLSVRFIITCMDLDFDPDKRHL